MKSAEDSVKDHKSVLRRVRNNSVSELLLYIPNPLYHNSEQKCKTQAP